AAASITTADLGQLDWPVDGKVVYQFGTAAGPNNTRIPWHGIGIAAPQGTPVRAIASGTVSLAGRLGTYLTSVLLDHGGGYYSFYGYLNDAAVSKGERVLKGQVIGHVGGEAGDRRNGEASNEENPADYAGQLGDHGPSYRRVIRNAVLDNRRARRSKPTERMFPWASWNQSCWPSAYVGSGLTVTRFPHTAGTEIESGIVSAGS